MKRSIVLLAVNVVILGFLLSLTNALSVSAIQLRRWAAPDKPPRPSLTLPNLSALSWAPQHFAELGMLETEYYAFYGWRRKPFSGETINVNAEGVRYTPSSSRARHTVAFLGGSTMWGTGTNDGGTIPSYFARMRPEFSASNFGEVAYTAHQSLSFLWRKYSEGFRPDVVVFYDGANEVAMKCRSELSPFSHMKEQQIRALIKQNDGFMSLIGPVRSVADAIGRRLDAHSIPSYDCHFNPDKVVAVAQALVADWLMAKSLVESYGGTFLGVLQPVAYFSHTRKDHLELPADLRRQYRTVYPRLVDAIKDEAALEGHVLDLRHAFDRDEFIYVDFCHVSPNGNEIIAQRIAEWFGEREISARVPLPKRLDSITAKKA